MAFISSDSTYLGQGRDGWLRVACRWMRWMREIAAWITRGVDEALRCSRFCTMVYPLRSMAVVRGVASGTS